MFSRLFQQGANPYGLQDLVGSVWQLTNDEYISGSHRYIILKGGSYFKPSGSWWYVWADQENCITDSNCFESVRVSRETLQLDSGVRDEE